MMDFGLNAPAPLRQAAQAGNRWIDGDDTGIAVTDPTTGKVIGNVPNPGQDDTLNRMMFPIRREIECLSTSMALHPGDTILTGMHAGAGTRYDSTCCPVPGDAVEAEVDGIGTLRNTLEDKVV